MLYNITSIAHKNRTNITTYLFTQQYRYGDKKSWLEPLRSIWEGAEGICWLMSVGSAKIESGAFYLDREPQPKHIAGNFYYEGTATKNSPEEIDKFLENLERANDNSKALHSVWRGLAKVSAEKLAARATPGAPSADAIDLMRFMQNWHVLATQPIEVSLSLRFKDLFSILLTFYVMWSCALESSVFLQPYSIKPLV